MKNEILKTSGTSNISDAQSNENLPKILAEINHTTENTQLEQIGSLLTDKQFLELLQAISDGKLSVKKLAPLLVGVTPQVFLHTLEKAQESHLEILKKEGILEPIEHHINLLFNTLDILLQNNQKTANQIDQKIEQLDLDLLTYSQLQDIENDIDRLKEQYRFLVFMINKALAITWNTRRLDLIEKLSRLKEKINLQFIQDELPQLSTHLQKFLYKVYDSPPHEIQDHDKSIEGLTKLSLWYLEDYWEAGLLPTIKKLADLERGNEEEKLHYRQQLFDQTQANLDQLGLGTIEKLKEARIFSKPMLKEFIAKARK